MLYTGTTSICSFKYSVSYNIVKKLKRRSLSVINEINKYNKNYVNIFVNSETLRNEIIEESESIKIISIHKSKHLKPRNDEEFGYYLAGLIDGDGHFSSKQQLVIAFNISDTSLAYYIKNRLGYGIVRKVKNKNAVLFIIATKKGIEKVLYLINNKIRTDNKYIQIIENIFNNTNFIELNKNINFNKNNDGDFLNHWLAGFTDADGCFQVKILNRLNKKTEIRLNFQIDQKKKDILLLIKKFLGGNIGYRQSQDTYYYGSTSFGSAIHVIHYFDQYHLLSKKYNNYLKWRKVYILIQNRDHLNEKGVMKIRGIKNTMNSFDTSYI